MCCNSWSVSKIQLKYFVLLQFKLNNFLSKTIDDDFVRRFQIVLIQNLWFICNCHIVCNKIITIFDKCFQIERVTNCCTGLGINLIESVCNRFICARFFTLFTQFQAFKYSLVILVARSSDRLLFEWFKHIYQWGIDAFIFHTGKNISQKLVDRPYGFRSFQISRVHNLL